MKAWQLTTFGTTLELVDVPEPSPGLGEVVVDVRASGLCTSDLHIMDGSMLTMARPPVVIGHEIAGVVSAVGEGVDGFLIGERVGIDPTASGVSGPGARTGGGYSEKTTAKPHELVRIPDGVSFVQAAAATDAGTTARRAVHHTARVIEGSRVAIVGLGVLGLTGARLAVLAEADVYAVDIDETAFPAAEAAGVKQCFTDVADLAPLELDVIIDFAGMGTTTAGAIEAVRHGGRVVQVGLGVPQITIRSFSLVTREVELVGSLGGSPADTAALYELIASGDLTLATGTIGFDEINSSLARMRRGEIRGKRLVAEFAATG